MKEHAGSGVLQTATEIIRDLAVARRQPSTEAIACVAALASLRACSEELLSAVALASSDRLHECSTRQISVLCRMLADASVHSGTCGSAPCPMLSAVNGGQRILLVTCTHELLGKLQCPVAVRANQAGCGMCRGIFPSSCRGSGIQKSIHCSTRHAQCCDCFSETYNAAWSTARSCTRLCLAAHAVVHPTRDVCISDIVGKGESYV